MKHIIIGVFACLALLLGSDAIAQQQDVVGLTDFPAPAWPQDGVIPASMHENYVFIDLPKNEYVVAYPENLGTDTFAKDGPGKLKINRYPLLRDVVPSISLTIAAAPAGRFNYSYTVGDGTAAKQSIDQFVLNLTSGSADDTVKPPDGWFAILQKDRKFKLRNPEWIRTGMAAIWSFQKIEQVIQPGASKKGFDIESDLRPGFTVAYLRKSESTDVKIATQGNVPKEVKEQMDPVLALEYDSKTVLTIGPKFDKTADDHTVADDFVQGIFTLSRAGALDLNSDFARAAISELTAVKPGVAAAGVVKLSPPPQGSTEAELANAIKISLRLN